MVQNMNATRHTVRQTRSLCPICLQSLTADLVQREDETLLCRTCPEHGYHEEVIWRGLPDFTAWTRPKKADSNPPRQTSTEAGCPYDCGLCPEHAQKSCAVLYEITDDCNLNCPVCFADSGHYPAERKRTSRLEDHRNAIRWIHSQAGQAVLQISGGEPTLSPHLIPIVAEAASLFPAVQLNTNGILLAERPELAVALAESKLGWVFLQFDGVSDTSFIKLRGKALLQTKLKAIENCRQAGLAVVLVPTVARGVNEHEMGALVKLALTHAPTVRGVHFQPMTRAGRNVFGAGNSITLPEVLQKLEQQTGGMVQASHASPPGCEHERCSFHCRYTLQPDGGILPSAQKCCCAGTPENSGKAEFMLGRPTFDQEVLNTASSRNTSFNQQTPESADSGANTAIASVVRNWQKVPELNNPPKDPFESFIARKRATAFSLTCMAFQDAWNIDLQRLQGCCIHVYAPAAKNSGPRLIPFCSYNLTSAGGVPLHRNVPPAAQEALPLENLRQGA